MFWTTCNRNWERIALFITLAMFACTAFAEVNAESFAVGKPVNATNFQITLEKLAQKWDDESTYGVVFHDGMSDRQLWYAHGQVDTLDKCVKELRQAIREEQAKDAKTDAEADLFLDAKQNRDFDVAAVQEQGFGQQPPQPQPSVSPYTPRPEDTNGNPILVPTKNQVQKQPLQAPTQYRQAPQYGAMSCAAGTTYRVQQTYQYGGRRLFGRRGGLFRGRFRGC